jgi:hypothetical protein
VCSIHFLRTPLCRWDPIRRRSASRAPVCRASHTPASVWLAPLHPPADPRWAGRHATGLRGAVVKLLRSQSHAAAAREAERGMCVLRVPLSIKKRGNSLQYALLIPHWRGDPYLSVRVRRRTHKSMCFPRILAEPRVYTPEHAVRCSFVDASHKKEKSLLHCLLTPISRGVLGLCAPTNPNACRGCPLRV